MSNNNNHKDPYSDLASVIENTINAVGTALDSAARGVSSAWSTQKQSEYFKNLHLNINQTPKQGATDKGSQPPPQNQNQQVRPVQPRRKKKLRIDRKGLSIPGAIFLGGGLFIAACSMGDGLFTQPAFFDIVMTAGFGISSILVLISGIRSDALYKIACRYGRVIGNFPEYSISALSNVMQSTKAKVQKDLERLLEKGYFGKKAYLDYGGDRIVIDPDEARIIVQNRAEEPSAQEPEAEPSDEYDVWLKKIKEANQKIDDAAVTLCVNRIHLYTEKIFEFIRVHPEDVGQIRTFMNYYLPMTLKLLQSYDMLEEAGVAGENMRTTKKNIEETLETLAGAYRQQLDNLYSAQAMDISADIDVLEQMLRRDGLDNQDDFSSGTATAQDSEEM